MPWGRGRTEKQEPAAVAALHFSCTETPPESATNCGQPTSTRQRADRELAGTSSRRATCRRPSAARAAALARSRGAESIEHLDADRRGRGRGKDRGGARRAGGLDCQIDAEAYSSYYKSNSKNLGPRRPRQPGREAPLGLRFLQTYLVPEEKACEVLPTARYYGPPLKTRGLPFRALPDLPTPSHQLSN